CIGARADEGVAGRGGERRANGHKGVWRQYGLWEDGVRADFARPDHATAIESGAEPCVRCRHAAERTGDARDAAAARECAGEGLFGHPAGGGGNVVRDAGTRSASGDSVAGVGGCVGGFGAAGTFGAGGGRRRRSDLSREETGRRGGDEASGNSAGAVGSEGGARAAEWDTGDAGAAL